MGKLFERVLGAAILALFLVIGLKSCIVTVWSPPREPTTYSIDGIDGRSMIYVLLPSHEAIIAYGDPAKDAAEVILSSIDGTVGTHYIGRIWNLSDEGSLFGLRLYPEGVTPIRMEMKVLEKNRSGRGESVFPRIGEETKPILLLTRDSMRFAGMWLRKVVTDSSMLAGLQAAVRR